MRRDGAVATFLARRGVAVATAVAAAHVEVAVAAVVEVAGADPGEV